jgi:hypothetical protein
MQTMKSEKERELCERADRARSRLQDLAANLRVVDDEVEKLAPQRQHHALLDQACGASYRLCRNR